MTRFYYGAGVEPPQRFGDLAIEVSHKSEISMKTEVMAGKSRKDIGRIEVRNIAIGEPWQVVQHQHSKEQTK